MKNYVGLINFKAQQNFDKLESSRPIKQKVKDGPFSNILFPPFYHFRFLRATRLLTTSGDQCLFPMEKMTTSDLPFALWFQRVFWILLIISSSPSSGTAPAARLRPIRVLNYGVNVKQLLFQFSDSTVGLEWIRDEREPAVGASSGGATTNGRSGTPCAESEDEGCAGHAWYTWWTCSSSSSVHICCGFCLCYGHYQWFSLRHGVSVRNSSIFEILRMLWLWWYSNVRFTGLLSQWTEIRMLIRLRRSWRGLDVVRNILSIKNKYSFHVS